MADRPSAVPGFVTGFRAQTNNGSQTRLASQPIEKRSVEMGTPQVGFEPTTLRLTVGTGHENSDNPRNDLAPTPLLRSLDGSHSLPSGLTQSLGLSLGQRRVSEQADPALAIAQVGLGYAVANLIVLAIGVIAVLAP